MKALKLLALGVVTLLVMASSSFAAEGSTSNTLVGPAIGAGLGAGLIIIGAGIGFGKIGAAALRAWPPAGGGRRILPAMIVIAALLEGDAVRRLRLLADGRQAGNDRAAVLTGAVSIVGERGLTPSARRHAIVGVEGD
jgi:F-type H+-transporting ATPase subunit c